MLESLVSVLSVNALSVSTGVIRAVLGFFLMRLTCVCCSERVLGVVHSEGLHDPGPVRWPLALCLLAAWVVIFLCMLKGIRSSGKVNQHKVVIVCSHKTHTHTQSYPALLLPSCRPNVRLCYLCL